MTSPESANLASAEPFVTKDGSLIRELHHTARQSLAEATLEPGQATERHFHRATEEIYFFLEGRGRLELDGRELEVGPGDAVLIPPGVRHELRAADRVRILCCCAPPYSHEDTFLD